MEAMFFGRRMASTINIPPVSKVKVSVVNPRTIYKREMRRLRKQYASEHANYLSQKRLAESQHDKLEAELRLRRQQEIKNFKLAREKANKEFESNVVGTAAGLGGEFVGGLDIKPKSTDEFWNDFVNEMNSSEFEGEKKEAGGDPRQKLWKEYINRRKLLRFKSHLETLSLQSAHKTESILYLYHQAANFITFSNLEDKLRAAFPFPGDSSFVTNVGSELDFYKDKVSLDVKMLKRDWSDKINLLKLEKVQREQALVRALKGMKGDTTRPDFESTVTKRQERELTVKQVLWKRLEVERKSQPKHA